MKLTPIDIQQQQFSRRVRGLDAREVASFLELVAGQVEELMREHRTQRDELRQQERELAQFREREQALKETMLTAQRVTEDLREQAKKEAELVVSEAELKAEKIMHNAHSRVVKILEDINELKRQRAQLLAGMRGVIGTHTKLLDVLEEGDGVQTEGSLALLRKAAPGPQATALAGPPSVEPSRLIKSVG